MADSVPTLGDYWAILKRRRKSFFITFFGITLAAGIVALISSPQYESTATILVEQQDIPTNLLPTSVTSYADQRLQHVSRRVLTSENLEAIIKKFNLYQIALTSTGLFGSPPVPLDDVVETMRTKLITLEVVDADVLDPKSGKSVQATIAFKLSFTDKDPKTSQLVADELTKLFLAENIRARTAQAENISSFLTSQLSGLQSEVANYEKKLADFKSRNAGKLPELAQVNTEMMGRVDSELSEVDHRVDTLEQQKVSLTGQAAQFATNSSSTIVRGPDGQVVMSPGQRLAALQTEYFELAAKYAPNHPDVVRARKEIEALKASTGIQSAPIDLAPQIADKRAELAEAQQKYGADHPDVRHLQSELDQLIHQSTSSGGAIGVAEAARLQRNALQQNPAYVQIQANLDSTNAELQSQRMRQSELRARRTEYEGRLNAAPEVEREYRELSRGYEAATTKLQEVQSKQLDAQLVSNMETEQKGERFTLIEPAKIPTDPTTPIAAIILFLGTTFAFVAAIAVVALREALDDTVRGREAIEQLMGSAPLATIPVIRTGGKTAKAAAAMLGALLVGHAVSSPPRALSPAADAQSGVAVFQRV